jgi:hypothetical protein
MPRKSRIDAAGALHDVMATGIARGTIVRNAYNRDQLLERLGETLQDTKAILVRMSGEKIVGPQILSGMKARDIDSASQ